MRLLILTSVMLLSLAGAAFGQSSNVEASDAALPEALQPESIRDLAADLDPEQVRALAELVELLGQNARPSPADSAAEAAAPQRLTDALTTFLQQLLGNLQQLPAMITSLVAAFASLFSGLGLGGTFAWLAVTAAALVAGWAVETGLRKLLRGRVPGEAEATPPDGLRAILTYSGLRIGTNLLAIAAFTISAILVIQLAPLGTVATQLATGIVAPVILIPRVAASLLRFFLAPNRPDLRLVTADDQTVKRVFADFVKLSSAFGIFLFVLPIFVAADAEMAVILRFWLGAAIVAATVFSIWRNRRGLTAIIHGGDVLTPGLERMAAWWPAASIIIIVVDWIAIRFLASGGHTITPIQGVLTLALILALPFIDTALRGLVGQFYPASSGESDVVEDAQNETRLSLIRIGRVGLIILLLVATGMLWGIKLSDVAEAGFGAQLAGNAFGFLLIIALGYIAWEGTNLWVYRRLSREMPAAGAGEGAEEVLGGSAQSRMATVLPILRLTLQFTIIALTVLLAASEIGINITPLLAGAGVIGLAVGFGAQTLVKDVVSGVFFLLDDAFRVGEFIDAGGTVGTVERISVRSLQLRHPSGPVHIIPYGEIPKVTNNSRDWVIVKMKFIVPFEVDLNKVRKLFKKIGQQMYDENPYYSDNIIQPFKFQGVQNVDDVGITVRGKFMAKPGSQFLIRKDIYNRVQRAFEENGIEFARREVRVKIPDTADSASMTDEDRQHAAAAAAEATVTT